MDVPLARLAEFLAHEQELLAGMAPHEAEISAKVGEPLPFVAGRLAGERAFAVDDFVVQDRQDEVLGEGVEQAERHLVMATTPIDRVARHVIERVVHPADVPFEAEAEPAEVGRRGHAGERGRFLGDRHRAGGHAVDQLVGALEEGDRVAVSRRRRRRWAAIRPACANNRDRASRRPRRRAGRRRGSGRSSRARWRRGSWRPRAGRNCRWRCSSRDGSRCADRRARRAGRRRTGEAMRVGREMGGHPVEDDADARGVGASTKRAKPSGVPKRRVGANKPIG